MKVKTLNNAYIVTYDLDLFFSSRCDFLRIFQITVYKVFLESFRMTYRDLGSFGTLGSRYNMGVGLGSDVGKKNKNKL